MLLPAPEAPKGLLVSAPVTTKSLKPPGLLETDDVAVTVLATAVVVTAVKMATMPLCAPESVLFRCLRLVQVSPVPLLDMVTVASPATPTQATRTESAGAVNDAVVLAVDAFWTIAGVDASMAIAIRAYSLKILLEPESQAIVISPPLGVIGSPVAESITAISGEVLGVPVSLAITRWAQEAPAVTVE